MQMVQAFFNIIMPTSSFKADSSLLASKADQRYELAISTITRSEFLKRESVEHSETLNAQSKYPTSSKYKTTTMTFKTCAEEAGGEWLL